MEAYLAWFATGFAMGTVFSIILAFVICIKILGGK